MAKPKKLESGSWFIQFMCKGVRKSGTFATSAEAKAWQVHETAEILKGAKGDIPDKTFGQLLEKYGSTDCVISEANQHGHSIASSS
jgi:hypothetical protein